MAKLVVVVADAFVTRGAGVVVAPRITLEGDPKATLRLRLRAPDGTTRETRAKYDVAHITGPSAPFAMLRLLDVTVADVPVGTEVWLDV